MTFQCFIVNVQGIVGYCLSVFVFAETIIKLFQNVLALESRAI